MLVFFALALVAHAHNHPFFGSLHLSSCAGVLSARGAEGVLAASTVADLHRHAGKAEGPFSWGGIFGYSAKSQPITRQIRELREDLPDNVVALFEAKTRPGDFYIVTSDAIFIAGTSADMEGGRVPHALAYADGSYVASRIETVDPRSLENRVVFLAFSPSGFPRFVRTFDHPEWHPFSLNAALFRGAKVVGYFESASQTVD